MSARRYVIGVDSGGAKVIALVADTEGHILGAARVSADDVPRRDLMAAMAEVAGCARGAIGRAAITADAVAVAVYGLTGADWPEDHEPRAALLGRAGIGRDVVVRNDAFVGLRAGTRLPYGVVVGAGSGTNTAAVAPDGREWAFGYYATGGGGADIGRQVMHAVMEADDGRGPETLLTRLLLGHLGYDSTEAFVRAESSGRVRRRQVLSLCPLAFAAAYEGDAVACDLLERQGKTLAAYAVALIRRFDMQSLEFDVVLAGSVFKGKGPLLTDVIAAAVHRVAPRARLVRPELEPAVGGVLLAYDRLGIAVSEEMYATLAETSPAATFFDTAGAGEAAASSDG